ncbi:MAG: hypothetical protein ACI4TK_04515 [Agathobacter sp.]
MKRYFYITIHFSPDYEGTVFSKYQDDLYINTETGEIYRKRLLYDFGWGQEYGFELIPQLSFEELIQLVEQKYTKEEIQQADIWRSNLYGAVAVIMQDYVKELVEFLSTKVDTDYFSNPSIRDNFKCFSFDSQKTRAEGKIPGGVLTRSYEDILKDYPQWERISPKVINQVYV